MTKRSRRSGRRQRSKVDRSGKYLDRFKLVLKCLLFARAIWRFLQEVIGGDPWDSHAWCRAER